MFTHTAAVSSGVARAKVHELLDVSIPNKAGFKVRESRDSDAHPNSRAVAVLFDVTGSMHVIPQVFMEKLPLLMGALVKKGVLADPQVLFGAVGDASLHYGRASCDNAPLQIGQFESGNEMDEAMANIYLERGGGGQTCESYELAMYYMARHTELDCLNKRGEKGYLFLIGDETPYTHVRGREVKMHIDETLSEDIRTEAILDELREKYEVFWIYPDQGSYTNDRHVQDRLQSLFGQRLIHLDMAENIVELIVGIIGTEEGLDLDEVAVALREEGSTDAAVASMTTALTAYHGAIVKSDKTAIIEGDLGMSEEPAADRI